MKRIIYNNEMDQNNFRALTHFITNKNIYALELVIKGILMPWMTQYPDLHPDNCMYKCSFNLVGGYFVLEAIKK